MATTRPQIVTVTRALLTLAAAASLARVFASPGWLLPIAIAAIAPAALLAFSASRRWNLFVAAAGTAVLGVAYGALVDAVVGPKAANTGTLERVRHDLSQAPHVLRAAVVPIHRANDAYAPALLLAVLAVVAVAILTDMIGRRLDAPVGAIGPSVALYVAVAAVGTGPWAATTTLYALAVVAFLVVLHQQELAARRTWFQAASAPRSRVTTGGLAVGAVVVLLAVFVGPAFPGARSSALVNYRKLGVRKGSSDLTAPSPFLNIQKKLVIDKNAPIFEAKPEDGKPYYWRAIALDVVDPKTHEWVTSPATIGGLQGASGMAGTHTVRQEIHMSNAYDPYWLPAVYRPIAVDLDGAQALKNSSTIFLPPEHSVAGATYTATSEVADATADQLRTATFADLDAMKDDAKPYPDFPAAVAALTHQLTDQAATPYDKALALENFFQGGDRFTYSTDVDFSNSPDALSDFVLTKRVGFCEQFAAAFASMARLVGLPTRIAVGYQSGARDGNGFYHQLGGNAHAWPEVWFGKQFGWVAFEPTKGRFDATTGHGDQSVRGSTGGGGTNSSSTTTTTAKSTTPTSGRSTTPTTAAPSIHIGGTSASHTSAARRALETVLLLVLVAAAVVVAGLGALVAQSRRRTRRRREAADPRRRVLGAWTEAVELLAAAGVSPRPSATSIEFALRHAPAGGAGAAGPPLMDLARLQTAAMFAAEEPTAADANDAWTKVDAIAEAVSQQVGRVTSWRSRLRLGRRQPTSALVGGTSNDEEEDR